MHIGRYYTLREFLLWTRRDIFKLLVLAILPLALFKFAGFTWIAIPWVPVALIGTAAAFIVGFKNTQTYNRLWEARQIWGGIVNTSRTLGIMVHDFVQADKEIRRQIILRHCAWLNALRYQLRKPQPWETASLPHNLEYRRYFTVPEWKEELEDVLKHYLIAGEDLYISGKKNKATQILALQGKHLAALKSEGKIGAFEYVELERRLADLYEHQGKCERIKNFPYPRQFASINLFFCWLFAAMLPLGMLNEFNKLGGQFIWLSIPFSVLVGWVFTSMEKVGEATENPFEGNANDIPMATMCITIEIDLLDMMDEPVLPEPLKAENHILM